MTGSKLPAVQRLQFFLSESVWDPEAVNARRLELLRADPVTAPHGGGVLVIDDSGDRKDGTKTAHVGRQYLGRYGKTDNGVVTVTTVWADERVYYPVHAVPYTPARHFAKGKNDPAFRTKLQIGADLAVRARAAGFAFRAVVADSAYGDQDGFRGELAEAGLPFVMALRPHRGTWARAADAHTPVEAARALAWGGPEDPGDWHPVTRTFRDGHARPGGLRTPAWADGDRTAPGAWSWPPPTRAPCRTRPPGTWSPTCPGPAARARPGSPHPAAPLAEIVRIYAIRNWIEQGYKQVKDELGGPTSRSAPISPSAATRYWSTARSASVAAPWPPARHAASRGRRRRREGGRKRCRRRPCPGPGRSAPCVPGSPRGPCCSAGGPHGPRRPRRRSCKP